MPDREKVISVYECCKNPWNMKCDECPIEKDCCHDGLPTFAIKDALELLKEQEAVKPQDAEMLIIHNGGAEEYVKDIESIVLLAHKDYDILYCCTFGRSVKLE